MLEKAIEALSSLEKQTRIVNHFVTFKASDSSSCAKILCFMVEACYVSKRWDLLNDIIPAMAKKRGQSKFAISAMVGNAMKLLENPLSREERLSLIDLLRKVTDGKIFLEVERAKLTRLLSSIKEAEGSVQEATSLMHDLQVETFGGLSKKEKVEFLLEQMRLGILNKDFMKTEIISRKISNKFFQNRENEVYKYLKKDLKLKYCQLMIELALNAKKYNDCSSLYYEMSDIHSSGHENEKAIQVKIL